MMNKRISTKQLAELLSDNTNLDRKGAEKFIDTLSSFIIRGIEQQQHVKILGFGTFKVILVKERESVHIQTGERFTIPSHHKLSFVPDTVFKNHINRPFAYFEPIETIDESRQTIKVIDEGEVIEALEITDEMVVSEQVEISEDAVSIEIITQEVITEEHIVTHVDTVVVEDEEVEAEIEPETETETETEVEVEPATEIDSEIEVDSDEIIEDEEIDVEEEAETDDEVEDDDTDDEVEEVDDEVVEAVEVEEVDELVEVIETKIKTEAEDIDKFIKNPESTSVSQPIEKQNKKRIPVWVQFVLYPLLFMLAVGIGTYAFLRYNAVNHQQGNDISNVNTDAQTYTEPLPIGFVRPDSASQSEEGSRIDDNQAAGEVSAFDPDEVITNIQVPMPDGDTEETTVNTETKEEIDWLAAPSSSSQRGQTRRADRPNSDTERSNSSRSSTQTDPKPDESLPVRIRMTQGMSLTQLAQEYYGDKIFWVYIYEHNKSRIKNFESIPIGTEVILPAAKTYGINAKSKASTDKALQRQRTLMKPKN
ncbi:MAG: HU family DNA-binding protein [Tannerella sp.]|jgi:nucleoid DNA-binding protein|nr:HU family DNA-binding protein [Tannerella sp.]